MRWLRAFLEGVAGLLLLALVLVGLLQVFGRYTSLVFVPWTEELARLLFVWVIWLGAAAGILQGGHMRFDFLLHRLPPRIRRAVEVAGALGVAAFLLLLIGYGYEVAQSQADTKFLTFNLSVQYTYLAAVAGSALMLLGLVGDLLGRGRGQGGSGGRKP